MKKKLAILGNGRLTEIVVEAYNNGLLEAYEITAICGRTPDKTAAIAAKAGCRACSTVEELLADKPDYVVEAASVQAMKDHAVEILEAGPQLVVLSIGSLADKDFYKSVWDAAERNNTKVHLVSGAIGGYDILRNVSLMGGKDAKASIDIQKPPELFEGTPLYSEDLTEQDKRVFEGTAAEAIALLPTQVNVAVAAALATIGPDKTRVEIDSLKDLDNLEQFDIYAEAEKAKVHIQIISEPHTSSGWSVVTKLRNLAAPIEF